MTLIARPTPPTVARPDPKSLGTSCGCAEDRDLDRLRDLMVRSGMGQWEASRLLWSPEVPPGPGMSPRSWVTHFVQQSFAAAFPWLRLPTPTEVSR